MMWRSFVMDEDGTELGSVLHRDCERCEIRASYRASVASQLRGSRCYATEATKDRKPNPRKLARVKRKKAWGT